jgi:predicted hydrocarbon binding protein
MINSAHIFHSNGLSLVNLYIDQKKQKANDLLFAGVSSAINTFLRELGHKNLQSITVDSGTLIYSTFNDLIFVVQVSSPDYELLGKFFVKQIELAFFSEFNNQINENTSDIIKVSTFKAFKETMNKIYTTLHTLYDNEPAIFRYFDPSIPISVIEELIKEQKDLLSGYPNDTIKLVRRLEEKIAYISIKNSILSSLGKYFGFEIAKNKFSSHQIITHKNVLQLLQEISIVSFDNVNEEFKMKICPICRKKKSNRPFCDFFVGFIEGAYNNPSICVKETKCIAQGDKECIYKIKRK